VIDDVKCPVCHPYLRKVTGDVNVVNLSADKFIKPHNVLDIDVAGFKTGY
jgi:hypothetical protein